MRERAGPADSSAVPEPARAEGGAQAGRGCQWASLWLRGPGWSTGRLVLAVLILALALPSYTADATKETILRVLTFNIKHGATQKGDFDLDVIAGVIQEARPDLVALQEVDVRTGRARGLDLASELAKRTQLEAAFGMAMPYDGGEYGVAILSRYPVVATRREALPYTGQNEPRVALGATIALPGGAQMGFVSTHLDNASEGDRQAQADALNERFGEGPVPTILAGDFNATPDSVTMARLKAQWGIAGDGELRPTFPSNAPEVTIDYILYRPVARWQVREARVIENALASDHFAYLVALEMVPETPASEGE